MSISKEKPVAVLGLGIIGSRACGRLGEAGWKVACWNRTPKGLPGEADSPEDAARGAAIISLYLKDSPATREVMERIGPVMENGQVVLNHATLDLETTKWLEEFCAARGCRFLDCPFTGSKVASATGQLLYYIGGDAGLAEDVGDYLGVTGKGQLYCGDVGSATVVKLATNLISACSVQAMAESMAIAARHGIEPTKMVEAVSLNACSSMLATMKMGAMAAGDYDTHFSLSNMAKDSRYMLAVAESVGLETPAIEAVSERMNRLAAEGLGDLDFSAVAKPYLEKE